MIDRVKSGIRWPKLNACTSFFGLRKWYSGNHDQPSTIDMVHAKVSTQKLFTVERMRGEKAWKWYVPYARSTCGSLKASVHRSCENWLACSSMDAVEERRSSSSESRSKSMSRSASSTDSRPGGAECSSFCTGNCISSDSSHRQRVAAAARHTRSSSVSLWAALYRFHTSN